MLELKVTAHNISGYENGKNSCRQLYEYQWFAETFHKLCDQGYIADEAAEEAIDQMPDDFTIKELFMLYRDEVTDMWLFEYDEKNVSWTDMSKDEDYLAGLISEGIQLKIVGILRPSDDTTVTNSRGSIGYLSSLTEYVINETNNTQIVKQQRENPQINVFTGEPFKTASTAASSQKTAPASDEGVTEQTTTAPEKENVSAFKAPSVGTL